MSLRRLMFCAFVFCIAVALLPTTAFAGTASTGSLLEPTSPQARTVAALAACPTCGGVGRLICPACGGAGTYFIIGYGGYMELWPCNVCQMTGSILCYTCLGTGQAPAVPYLVMNPTSMGFSATVGGGNPLPQALTVRRSDYGAWWTRISTPVAWAQVSFSAGIFYVSPQTAGLAPGKYTTNVLVEMWSNGVDGTPVQGSPLHVPVTFVVYPVGTVAAPTFTPTGGTFNSEQLVTIACATAGATIRYTTDGSDPTVSSALYSVPVNVSASGTLKARAFKTNWTGSAVAQAAFTISIPHTIVPTAGAGGTVSPPTAQTVNYGASKTFTITPNTGHHVASVRRDGVSIGAPSSVTFSNVTSNHTVSATFAINTYQLRPIAGAGGTVTPNTLQTVNYGGSKTFTITPASGYHVASVLIDGHSVGADTSYSFSNVTSNHTVSATFAINTYQLRPIAGAGGTVTPNTLQTVNYGGSRTFTITPASGYHVASVLIDGHSVGAVTSYPFSNVTADHTISARFVANAAAPIRRSTTTKLSGPSTVKVKRILKLTGTVVPSAARGRVTIVKTRLVGRTWKSAGSARVNISSGSYRYSFKPTKKGKWRFVAKYSGVVIGTTTYTASRSRTRSVRVK